MSKSNPECDCCKSPMILEKDFGIKLRGRKKYSIKRYKCAVCDVSTTLFANGVKDAFMEAMALKDVKELEHQEKDARN